MEGQAMRETEVRQQIAIPEYRYLFRVLSGNSKLNHNTFSPSQLDEPVNFSKVNAIRTVRTGLRTLNNRLGDSERFNARLVGQIEFLSFLLSPALQPVAFEQHDLFSLSQ
jgi:hypothetical protein